jgi:hypothetical protein
MNWSYIRIDTFKKILYMNLYEDIYRCICIHKYIYTSNLDFSVAVVHSQDNMYEFI